MSSAPVNVAARGVRFGAYVLDLVLLAVVIIPLHLVLFGSLRHTTLAQGDLAGVIEFLYQFVVPMRPGDRRGQTLGKQLAKIRVVKADGRSVGVVDLLIREIARNVVLAPAYFSRSLAVIGVVDPGWVLIDRENRALHDLVARTVVIDVASSG